MKRYGWAAWGDVNAFFGLMLDNVTVMGLLVVTLTLGGPDEVARGYRFTPHFVLTQMIPGTALGVLIGDLVYTWMAFRLARRSGRADVTAMPLGLDTPSTFGVALLVLLPALREGRDRGLDPEAAMRYAWHVGVVVLLLIGLFKVACAPLGNAVRRWVPRAGLLGSLAAVALALIAFVPLLLHVAPVPLVGVGVLTVILVTLVAHRRLPLQLPGALAAAVLGVVLYYALLLVGNGLGVPLVPDLSGTGAIPPLGLPPLAPFADLDAAAGQAVLWAALAKLPVALPFALATIVGGIDNTESAAAAGDEYDTRTILLTEGVSSLAAACLGGVIQTTPYIGHPAYKAMGGRAAYTLATALFVGAVGTFGAFGAVVHWLPEAALFPILVFVGLEITAQSFQATPPKHYAALALAALPTLAYLATIPLRQALGPRPPERGSEGAVLTLQCLANGFIVTSLLWAAALAALLDGRPRRSAAYLLLAAGCALFGVIHSPLAEGALAWPWDVYNRLEPREPAVLCQSPYHWAGAYLLAAGILLGLSFFGEGSAKE
jgi:AGZA family xanthine/uracil permease-like MFS transporter